MSFVITAAVIACIVLLALTLAYLPMRLLVAQGANVADGLDMLVFQAAASFTLWTGRAAPLQVMREAALAELRRRGAPRSQGPRAAGRVSGER